ncbi:hypothetical protein VOLCADRAFT_69095 [Volvox carteri f. nagariensis]|uniref:Protein arginine N-methyltransferase 2 n=1 Tax=Volvox carteri f. nagariensis TaxID=3068 RepID=D8UHN2_VOLCA|nr:uncharacterized protein VOLCADRAFT_69095 [Volvox carteri f. nagariensis]EFJ40778.1 hypothetical protein VOLCADRAFT_69095 [Volvox carteri f. nagariensis]|eukprot:XP_002958153.1 hypothetical protein VOLCADRAFT_69095 [Volvox carteri f. nagariensis]
MTDTSKAKYGESIGADGPPPSLEQQLLAAAAAGDADEVARLIELEADVDYQDEDGVSPLMKAAEGGHIVVLSALLQSGAPWNAQDKHGYCAGEYAMGSGHQEAVDLLLDFAVQVELVLGALERYICDMIYMYAAPNSGYLTQKLVYRGEQLLDADGEAVMMGWERPLMVRHAERDGGGGGGRVLNVGFGLGIVDTEIQSHKPERHTIVEAHPDVYEHMVRKGWAERPGVRILKGRWQDVLPELLAEAPYDGIFFDTYGEYYEEMRDFHIHLPRLLARDGVYSFFNGLASDNIFFHMVYCRLISLELASKGLTVEYEPLAVGSLGDEVWQGVRSKYWHFETYFLPRVTRVDPLDAVEEEGDEGGEGRPCVEEAGGVTAAADETMAAGGRGEAGVAALAPDDQLQQ